MAEVAHRLDGFVLGLVAFEGMCVDDEEAAGINLPRLAKHTHGPDDGGAELRRVNLGADLQHGWEVAEKLPEVETATGNNGGSEGCDGVTHIRIIGSWIAFIAAAHSSHGEHLFFGQGCADPSERFGGLAHYRPVEAGLFGSGDIEQRDMAIEGGIAAAVAENVRAILAPACVVVIEEPCRGVDGGLQVLLLSGGDEGLARGMVQGTIVIGQLLNERADGTGGGVPLQELCRSGANGRVHILQQGDGMPVPILDRGDPMHSGYCSSTDGGVGILKRLDNDFLMLPGAHVAEGFHDRGAHGDITTGERDQQIGGISGLDSPKGADGLDLERWRKAIQMLGNERCIGGRGGAQAGEADVVVIILKCGLHGGRRVGCISTECGVGGDGGAANTGMLITKQVLDLRPECRIAELCRGTGRLGADGGILIAQHGANGLEALGQHAAGDLAHELDAPPGGSIAHGFTKELNGTGAGDVLADRGGDVEPFEAEVDPSIGQDLGRERADQKQGGQKWDEPGQD
jgi:hypothetical protein